MINPEVITLGISLANLILKSTVSSVDTKIKAMRNENSIEKVRNNYDEIINELISEREEAIRIAQVYRNEIERIEISDTDIKHLNNTISTVLNVFKKMSPNTPVEMYEQLQGLINVDTLKAMQLLGFNYKAAIGEPLTELCANMILSRGKTQSKSDEQIAKNSEKSNKPKR